MTFKINQKVICVKTEMWIYRETRIQAYGPDKNQVCTVVETSQDDLGSYVRIKGYEQFGNYNATSFRPFESKQSAVNDLVNNFKDNIETSDIPVKELQTI